MKRGFTLIELLVLIAIVGILSAVVISNIEASKHEQLNASHDCQKYAYKNLAGIKDVPGECVKYYQTLDVK